MSSERNLERRLKHLPIPIKRLVANWSRIPANIRGAGFVAVGAFLLIVMASLVKQLGQISRWVNRNPARHLAYGIQDHSHW